MKRESARDVIKARIPKSSRPGKSILENNDNKIPDTHKIMSLLESKRKMNKGANK